MPVFSLLAMESQHISAYLQFVLSSPVDDPASYCIFSHLFTVDNLLNWW